MTEWVSVDHPQAGEKAAWVIRGGGLLILPTDTVYGVAADPWQPAAVAAIYEAKRRPPDRAIPILLADQTDMTLVSRDIPRTACQLAEAFWPGPLTIAVPRLDIVPTIVSSLPTIGLRVPDHEGTRDVIRACGGVLAVTSANRSGLVEAMMAEDAALWLGNAVALVLDGGLCQGGLPSTVVEAGAEGVRIVRHGPLSVEDLEEVLGHGSVTG
nr:threonylcarbamoyl-AMP synthase [Anaerolineae bacterium]